MAQLTATLSNMLGRTVIDQTGVTGAFDLHLTFTPDMSLALPGAPGTPGGPTVAPDPSGSSIFTAMQEQLGLRLESGRGPVEVIVIDQIERPVSN